MGISNCRICDSSKLYTVLEMGTFSLSGVFPEHPNDPVSQGHLTLLLCQECTLVQLSESFEASEMYGDNYGYRSGLNASMIKHLSRIVDRSKTFVSLEPGDVVLDIGSNDGTLLKNYDSSLKKIGIDPTSSKFADFYDMSSLAVPGFFNQKTFLEHSTKPARIITSIAMLYDLEDPVAFARDIKACLDADGVWVFEQSYMPWMILSGAYDTICHEHIEYYSLTSIMEILKRANLRAIDVEINDANGGSIRVIASHIESVLETSHSVVSLLAWEQGVGLNSTEFFVEFSEYVLSHGIALKQLVDSYQSKGKRVLALGASTKGSILIQHAKLNRTHIEAIAEVNEFKFGRWMANSDIPILEETDLLLNDFDVFLILPWHFRSAFSNRLDPFLASGKTVIWPLPAIQTQAGKETTNIHVLNALNLVPRQLEGTLFRR
jgi:hypothetical protein